MTSRPQPAMSDTARNQIEAYASYARAQQHSNRTISLRTGVISAASRQCGKDPAELDLNDVLTYLASDGWSRNTRATYRRALDSWFLWLNLTGRREDNPLGPVKAPTVPRGKPKPVTTDEAFLCIGQADGHLRSWFILAGYEGLRAHEVAKIRGEDFQDGRLLVLGKGGREWWLPIATEVHRLRRIYPQEGPWFPGRAGCGTVTANTVTSRSSDHMHLLGIKPGIHRFRHWFGTTVQRLQGDVRVTQELMRHESLSSTMVYTEVADRQREEAIAALPELPPRVSRGWKGPRRVS